MRRLAQFLTVLLLTLLTAATAKAQHDADSIDARCRAIDYYLLESSSLMELEKIDQSFDLLEHCHILDPESSAIKFLLASYYSKLGNESAALDMLEEIVEKEPENETYCNALVEHYVNTGNRKGAIAVYERIVDTAHSKSDIYKSLYGLYFEDGNYEKALKALDAIAKLEGNSLEIMMMRLQQYLYLGRSDEGIALVEQIIAENPDDSRFKTLLGDTYNIIGEEKLSEEIYLSVLAENPDEAYAMSALVDLYIRTDNIDGYDSIIERLLKNEKVDTEERLTYLSKHILYKDASDSTYVKPFMQEIIQLPFDQLEHHIIYSQYLEYKEAEAEEVVPVLEKIVELDPEDVSTIVKLLSYAIIQENLDAVLKYANDAILYMPKELTFYYYKGLSLYMLGNKRESIDIYREGLGKRYDDTPPNVVTDVFTTLGDAYYEFDMKDECYAAYDSALVYDPYNIKALNNYAYYLSLEEKELQRALEMSRKTIDAEPEEETYLDTYAWILFKLKRYEEAKAYAEKIISLNKETSPVVLHHIGDIFAKCGEIDKAVIYWGKARDAGDESGILEKKIRKRKYYRGAKD